MNSTRVLILTLLSFFAARAITANAQGADDPAKKILGMWRLVNTVQKKADGTSGPNPVYGPKGVGYIMYTDSGRMCATLADPTVPNWKIYGKPTEAEARNAVDHFHAYCGSYTLDAKGGFVVH